MCHSFGVNVSPVQVHLAPQEAELPARLAALARSALLEEDARVGLDESGVPVLASAARRVVELERDSVHRRVLREDAVVPPLPVDRCELLAVRERSRAEATGCGDEHPGSGLVGDSPLRDERERGWRLVIVVAASESEDHEGDRC